MKALAAIAVLLAATSAHAFTFADIPRNATTDVVTQKLKAAGFKVKKSKNEIGFQGKVFERDGGGVATVVNGKVVKIAVIVPASEDVARETYDEIRAALMARYGPPAETISQIREPFHEGDGYETEAIREGKGVFATRWEAEGQQLSVTINPALAVVVTYE